MCWCRVTHAAGSSVSLGADLLCIFDDARRTLLPDVVARTETCDDDDAETTSLRPDDDCSGDVEMMSVDEQDGSRAESNSGGSSTLTAETTAALQRVVR